MSDGRKRDEAYLALSGWTHAGAWWTRSGMDNPVLFWDALKMQLLDDRGLLFAMLGV